MVETEGVLVVEAMGNTKGSYYVDLWEADYYFLYRHIMLVRKPGRVDAPTIHWKDKKKIDAITTESWDIHWERKHKFLSKERI